MNTKSYEQFYGIYLSNNKSIDYIANRYSCEKEVVKAYIYFVEMMLVKKFTE